VDRTFVNDFLEKIKVHEGACDPLFEVFSARVTHETTHVTAGGYLHIHMVRETRNFVESWVIVPDNAVSNIGEQVPLATMVMEGQLPERPGNGELVLVDPHLMNFELYFHVETKIPGPDEFVVLIASHEIEFLVATFEGICNQILKQDFPG